ncbi:MAG: hypothetical protein MdMp024_1514 [Bacteroidales bacterium]
MFIMDNFTYKIEHDFGLAPNPFWGYCTLAVCKSDIRKNKNLQVGSSWIFGIGSKTIGEKYFKKLIFCMKVEEKLTFNEYWNDSRFQCKKPIIYGSLQQMYGDNFYHHNENGDWIQENSAHSLESGLPNENHLKRDTGGEFVLVSKTFYYFGENAILIPENFESAICACANARNFAFAQPGQSVNDFIDWLQTEHQLGIYGDPISWSKYYK